MLIERLIVRKTAPVNEVIRDIRFNLKGLSLILDNTTGHSQDSGNNVGKTTAIKIIDLCLGGKSTRSLYYDSDTKSENVPIKKLLKESKVEAELVLLRGEKKVKVVRQLFPNGRSFIDGEAYPQREFWHELKRIIFASDEPNPTFRQLISKFVRVNDATDERIIKFLESTSNDTYDTIYLFLFGILSNEILNQKDIIASKLRDCESKHKMLEKDINISSLDSLKQKSELVEKELTNLLEKRKQLNYMDTYKEELEKRRQLTVQINQVEQMLELLEFDLSTMTKNINRLEDEKSNIDVKYLKSLYAEANEYIDSLDKTFDALLAFHNSMIQNRIDFITSQLKDKEEEIQFIKTERDTLLEAKKNLTIDLLDEGLLDELNVLNAQIETLNVQKGEINQSLKILTGVKNEIQDLSRELKEIDDQLEPDAIHEKISAFNEYFSAYCEALYGEKYVFVYHSHWREQDKFPVSLDAFKGSVGTGMKKGVIVAFDLAYMKYAQQMGISAPKFVIHDKLENTHINQLKTVFQLSNEIDGQYIIPILRERVDKVNSDIVDKVKVLELSSHDRFFKVD